MKGEMVAIAAAVAVGGGAGWWLAGPKAGLPGLPTAKAASSPLSDARLVRADAADPQAAAAPPTDDAAREAVKDEAVVAGLAFQAHPCHPAYRARWLAAYKAYMRGWMAGRGADGETGPDWKSTKDGRIGLAMNAIHDKGLITDAEFADITLGVSPEGAQMLASTPEAAKPAGLPERSGCRGSEPAHVAG